MIAPTVGRVLHFYPGTRFTGVPALDNQPLPAMICHVWSDTCVNIAGFDANGSPFALTSVLLVQEDNDIPPPGSNYACWMPYQKAVATGEIAATLHK